MNEWQTMKIKGVVSFYTMHINIWFELYIEGFFFMSKKVPFYFPLVLVFS